MSSIDIDFILSSDVQHYINAVYKESNSIESLLLKKPPYPNWTKTQYISVLNQLEAKRRLAKKLPHFLELEGIIYPAKLHLEQSSSEQSAQWKCNQILLQHPTIKTIIDGTGGFGIDSFYFAQHFEQVIYIEPNAELLRIVAHNFKVLGISNVGFHCMSVEEFLNNNSLTESNLNTLLYLDPSRRDEEKNRVFALEQCSPNVNEVIELLESKQLQFPIVVKASPALSVLDLELKQPFIHKIQCLDIQNDAKELLLYFQVEERTSQVVYEAHSITNNELYFLEERESFKEAKEFFKEKIEAGNFIYEPFASVMKLGLFNAFASRYSALKIAPKTNFFLAQNYDSTTHNIQAKVYQLIKELPFNKSILQAEVGKRANIVMRNSSFNSVSEFCKKMNIQDGGEQTLLLFKNYAGKQECWLAKRILS